MGDVIYLKHYGAEHSSEVEGFVLTYLPINPELNAGEQPMREHGLPLFGRPHPISHGKITEF